MKFAVYFYVTNRLKASVNFVRSTLVNPFFLNPTTSGTNRDDNTVSILTIIIHPLPSKAGNLIISYLAKNSNYPG